MSAEAGGRNLACGGRALVLTAAGWSPTAAACGMGGDDPTIVKMADETDREAFDVKRVGSFYDNWGHRRIGRVQFDDAGVAVVRLDRGLPVQEGNHGLTISGGRLFLHDDNITREDAVFPHGGAFHTQCEGFSSAQHALGDLDDLGLWDRLDGIARRDNAD